MCIYIDMLSYMELDVCIYVIYICMLHIYVIYVEIILKCFEQCLELNKPQLSVIYYYFLVVVVFLFYWYSFPSME